MKENPGIACDDFTRLLRIARDDFLALWDENFGLIVALRTIRMRALAMEIRVRVRPIRVLPA